MRSNRKVANLACEACVDSYYGYNVISDPGAGESLSVLTTVDSENVHAAIYGDKKHRLLCFRGSDDSQDWLENLKFWPEKHRYLMSWESLRPFVPSVTPKVYGGFNASWRKVSPQIRSITEDYGLEGVRWIVTGHSLGGALAALAVTTMNWELDPDLVTFGCPKWGNSHAVWIANQKSRTNLRFINKGDWTPIIPGTFSWTHGTPPISLRGDGRNLKECHDMMDYRIALKRYTGYQ